MYLTEWRHVFNEGRSGALQNQGGEYRRGRRESRRWQNPRPNGRRQTEPLHLREDQPGLGRDSAHVGEADAESVSGGDGSRGRSGEEGAQRLEKISPFHRLGLHFRARPDTGMFEITLKPLSPEMRAPLSKKDTVYNYVLIEEFFLGTHQ